LLLKKGEILKRYLIDVPIKSGILGQSSNPWISGSYQSLTPLTFSHPF
jgi:hypothetical protein